MNVKQKIFFAVNKN